MGSKKNKKILEKSAVEETAADATVAQDSVEEALKKAFCDSQDTEKTPEKDVDASITERLETEKPVFKEPVFEKTDAENKVDEIKSENTEKIIAESEPVEENPVKKDDDAAPIVKMVVVLTVICTVIAGLLSIVNAVTKDVIAANAEKAVQEAIFTVFPDGDDTRVYTAEDGSEVYIVLKNNDIIGYTVNYSAGGYVGPVDMMIGVDESGSICGIRIISMGETPGVGTKISGQSFLSQFIGMNSKVVFGENADAISGATFSSRAVS